MTESAIKPKRKRAVKTPTREEAVQSTDGLPGMESAADAVIAGIQGPGEPDQKEPPVDLATDAPVTEDKSNKPATHLRVASYAPRRCRAGRFFTPEPVEIPLAELSEEQIEQLDGDAYLMVERV